MAISDARHRANEKYNAKAYDEIKVRVAKGRKEEIQTAAAACGESVNAYISRAITERMEREQSPGGTQRPAGAPQTDEYTGPGSAKWWAERAPQEATEVAGQFPYFPDDEDTPHAAVGTSPMEDEKSSPADQTRPEELPF